MAAGDMEILYGLLRVELLGPVVFRVTVGPFQPIDYVLTKGSGPMQLNLGDHQATTVHVQGLDVAQQAGQFTSPPVWTVDDPTIIAITPSADGLSCDVRRALPVKLGETMIHVTDADDPSVPGIDIDVTLTVEAVSALGVTIDPPVEIVDTP